MTKCGLLVLLKAKPGKENEVENFIKGAVSLAQAEPSTVTWYAFKIDSNTFGVFDTFPDETARQKHLNGPIAEALLSKAAELLVTAPEIQPIDILSAKTIN
jgi:quinol monooxygenase YgiN